MELFLLSFLPQFQGFQGRRLMSFVLSMRDPKRLKKKAALAQ
jgi:hypothetical protein